MSRELLEEGNARFVKAADPARLKELAEGQSPYACVITCSDSRVPPELIFGAGLGEIFVIRTAGNTAADPMTLGSAEYAVEHLGVPVLVVLGHTCCGAVGAAMGETPDGNLGELVEAVRRTCGEGDADRRCRHNAAAQVEELKSRSETIRKAEEEGRTNVVAALYDLETGSVEFF